METIFEEPEPSIGSPLTYDPSIMVAALRFASLGFWVVRLKERSKVPDIKDWSLTGKTKDPELIRRWFRERPLANIGIVCGNGLVVIDIDDRDDGAVNWLTFVGEHGPNGELGVMPLTAVTPRRGLHLYFRVPVGVKIKNRMSFIPGVDIRGDGGFVVAPPSVHPNGERYAWGTKDFATRERFTANDDIPMIPDWLLRRIVSEQAGAQTQLEREPSSAPAAETAPAEGEFTGQGIEQASIDAANTGAPVAADSITLNDPKREANVNGHDIAEPIAEGKVIRRTRDHTRTSKKAPRRPPERSRGEQAQSDGQKSWNASRAKLGPPKSVPHSSAALDTLVADVKALFPVPAVGHRHRQMNRAVFRLVGKGHEDSVIVEVMMRWFEHFDSQGKIGSDRTTMEKELAACLRTTRSKPGFTSARTSTWHVKEIARVMIPQSILVLFRIPVHELEAAEEKRRAKQGRVCERNEIGISSEKRRDSNPDSLTQG
jgi:hypothetical protein